MFVYKRVEDVKEDITLYIESKTINVKNTIRDLNIFVKKLMTTNKEINLTN